MQYDPETGILHCDGCQQPLNVKKYKPGRKVMCPGCQRVLRVPKSEGAADVPAASPAPPPADPAPAGKRKGAAGAEPVFDAVRKVLTCPGCQSQYRVAGYTPGRKIMCVTCETLLTVPAFKSESSRLVPVAEEEPEKREEPPEEKPAPPPPEEEPQAEAPAEPAEKPEKPPRETRKKAEKTDDDAPSERPAAVTGSREKTGKTRRQTSRRKVTTRRTKKRTGRHEAVAEDAPAEPTPEDLLGGKRLLTCSKCESVYNVTSIDIGRKILCLRCETIMKVTADLPIVKQEDLGGLNVIELGGDDPGANSSELTSTRKAFKQFYDRESTRAIAREKAEESRTSRRHRTDRTIRVSAEDLVRMVDREKSGEEDEEHALDRALARQAALRSQRAEETKGRSPLFMIFGTVVLVLILAGTIGFFVHRGRVNEQRARERAEQAAREATSTERKTGTDVLTPGQTVVFLGLVPGHAEVLAEGPIGTILSTRSRIVVWAEVEPEGTDDARRVFREARKIRDDTGGRICLKVTARVRPVPSGMVLPEDVDKNLYLSVLEAELIGFQDWRTTHPHINVLGGE